MKAIIRDRYGPPEVVQLVETEKPATRDGRLVVQVYAASGNPIDWHEMRGAPFIARLSSGLLKPKDRRLGTDISGIIETIGNNVTKFKPGDAVFGTCPGGFAEYASAREDRVAQKPHNISFEQAAAVPVAATTALQGLRDKGRIHSGQKVLVNGASGGVGHFAVQIAKSYGTEVTGVCSTRNMELVSSIGADHVVDYTKEDFTRQGKRYDLIFDAVGNRSVSDYKRALNPGGICAVAGFSGLSRLFEHAIIGPARSRGDRKVGLMGMAQVKPTDLEFLKELLEAGKIVPTIDREYPLTETAEAMRYLEAGHARGKVIIGVKQPDS